MERITIMSVNVSEKKGTIKHPVDHVLLDETGIAGDAHAGHWHRQVSMLGIESIKKMQSDSGRDFINGEFAENITTSGYPVYNLHPLDRLTGNGIELEVTQIGKKCHGEKCTIFRQTGDCVMPREGIFCRVIKGGTLRPGDILEIVPRIFRTKVITLSDRASAGEYEDQSGPQIVKMMKDFFEANGRASVFDTEIIPDEPENLRTAVGLAGTDFIVTTGGTGIGPRDITPEVIRPMLDKEIPGLMEMIRIKYGMQFPNALISRSLAGVIGKSLIYVLPGSPKAVKEYMNEILGTLDHSLMMLHGIDKH
jgi:molybdenum cofactor synthesis domain-containing protein